MPIQCDLCLEWVHGKCEKLKRKEWILLGNSNVYWYCNDCNTEIFPFNKLDNDELFEYFVGFTRELQLLQNKCIYLEKNVKQNKNEKHLSSSSYLTRDQLYSRHINIKQSFSVIHFNCRSL